MEAESAGWPVCSGRAAGPVRAGVPGRGPVPGASYLLDMTARLAGRHAANPPTAISASAPTTTAACQPAAEKETWAAAPTTSGTVPEPALPCVTDPAPGLLAGPTE